MAASTPPCRASSAADSSDSAAEAMVATLLRANTGLDGSGGRLSSLASSRAALSGRSSRYSAARRLASVRPPARGRVGPEATSAGSSPGTSETTSVATRAGAAAAASRPPLMVENWLRMRFITPIGAPEASSARLIVCSSSRSRPPAGAGSNDEPPPEISATTRSSSVSSETNSISRAAASSPAASGTGWAASTISMRSQGSA